MLDQTLKLKRDKEITINVMTILQLWDPRVRTKSKLEIVENHVQVSAGALDRDISTPQQVYMFNPEKEIITNTINALVEIISTQKELIVAKTRSTLSVYHEHNNILQGLIYLTTIFYNKFHELEKKLQKAEKKVKKKRSFKHLISADLQNMYLMTAIYQLQELIETLREAQISILRENGDLQNRVEGVLDQPTFILADGLEVYIPYKDPNLVPYLRNVWENPLESTLRFTVSFENNVRLITMCPSWHHQYDGDHILEGPNEFLLSNHRVKDCGQIAYQPLNLSVLMNFNATDTTGRIAPFVQIALEIALIHTIGTVIFHAPIGCADILCALGFKLDDELDEAYQERMQRLLAQFEHEEPITYDNNEVLPHIDCLDETFIQDRLNFKFFTLDLNKLNKHVVLLSLAEGGMPPTTTTWPSLLARRRYIPVEHSAGIIPPFLNLPTIAYTPSFRALMERPITGRLPKSKLCYQNAPVDAADFLDLRTLSSIGSLSAIILDVQNDDEALLVDKLVKCKIK